MSEASRSDQGPADRHPEHEDTIAKLVCSYMDRLIDGERIAPEEVLRDHPTLGPSILDELETFTEIGSEPDDERRTPLGTLGDYTLRRQIGRGGMGVVYEAWENSMDRAVALKVLPPGVAADNKAFTRFLREAKTAGQLRHENIVGVYSTGVKDGTPWYAMEYVEGQTLAQILSRLKEAEPEDATPFGMKDDVAYFGNLARAFGKVADALQHAHSKGVTHRDIKPSNLILDGEGKLRILDFGLARLEGQESLTLSGDLMGTVLYMSPEQAMAKRVPLDHRTDVYSLGATMYELLTGQPPSKGKDRHDTLSQIIVRDPRPPRQLNPRVPRDFETVVLKCLRKDAGDRYGTAEALAQDLRRFVRGDAVEARPEGTWHQIARRTWRHRLRIGVIALLVLLVSANGALFMVTREAADRDLRAGYERGVLEAAIATQYAMLSPSKSVGSAYTVDPSGFYAPPPSRSGGVRTLKTVVETLRTLSGELPDRPDAYYHLSRALFLGGREQDALRQLENALERDRTFAPARILEATVLERLGHGKKAEDVLEELPMLKSGWARGLLEARAAENAANWIEAVAAYESVLQGILDEQQRSGREPYIGATAEALLGRGMAYLKAGDHARAIQDFAAAKDRYRGALEPALLLGQAWVLKGDPDAARSVFRELHDRSSGQTRDDVALAVATVYGWVGEADKVLEWAGRIRDEALRERTRIPDLLLSGRRLSAARAADRAVAGYPEDPLARVWLAWAHDSRGAQKTVLGHLETALELDPDHGLAHLWLGFHLVRGGDLPRGIAHLKRAEALTDNPLAYTRLAQALYLEGKKEEADKQLRWSFDRMDRYYSRGLRTSGRHPVEGFARSLYSRFLWKQKRFGDLLDKYANEYAKAFAVPPETVWVRRDTFLSTVLAESGVELPSEPLNRAIEALEGGLDETEQDSPDLRHALARLLAHRGQQADLPRAIEYARGVVKGNGSRNSSALLLLADLEARLGDVPAAVLILERGLAQGVDDPRLALALDDYRREALPEIASCASADALLEEGTSEILVPKGANWRFFRGGQEPSADLEWTAIDFDHGRWESGRAGFGYGLSVLDYGTHLDDMVGSYTTLYVRRLFEVTDPESFKRLRLIVWLDEGFVAYLNGVEIARAKAGHRGERIPHDASAISVSGDWSAPRLCHAVVDQGLLVPGTNCIAIQGLNEAERGQTTFYLDAILVGTKHRELAGERLLSDFRALARGKEAQARALYVEGRLLQTEGNHDEAAETFRVATESDRSRPEPFLRRAECLRAAGKPEQAEQSLRDVLKAFRRDRELWRLWHEIAAVDLELDAREMAAKLGAGPWTGYGSDVFRLLAELAEGGVVRIDCGARRDTPLPDGSVWGRDRFFRGGRDKGRPYTGAIEGAEVAGDGAPYRTGRRFWPATLLPPAYSVPLPRGEYRLTLHFAEMYYLPPIRRRFTVFVEGKPELRNYGPPVAAVGSVTAERRTFPVTLSDGFLDLEFLHQHLDPMVCGIEIEAIR